MSGELSPCPFCGHPPVLRPIKNDGRWIADCNTVTCIRPTTGLCRTEAEAVTAWNTRATDHHDEAEAYRNRCERAEADATELREEIARLREKVEQELTMTALANVEATSDWIDGFEFAWKRARAALGENTDG